MIAKPQKSREEVLEMLREETERAELWRTRVEEKDARQRRRVYLDAKERRESPNKIVPFSNLLKAYRSWNTFNAEEVGGVYFIQHGDGGAIKIGMAKNIRERKITLQGGTPCELKILGYIPDNIPKFSVERILHNHFASYRIRGEWFQPCQELLELCGLEVNANG